MKINKLDNKLINKIAAGEVIERPASVVKELVENSIDAQSTEIEIEIERSGLKKIIIKDNGIGMAKEDLLISIERHSTSKIKGLADLYTIATLGFRGEALASIAAISNLTIISTTSDNIEGTELEAESSKIINIKPSPPRKGTLISVKDLFFNVPARKKHLQSEQAEFNHILDIIQRYALSNPEITFRLTHNNKEIINAHKGNFMERIISLHGLEFSKQLLSLEFSKKEFHNLKIQGYIGKPSLTRSTKDGQSFFINNRFIKNKTISSALQDAFHTLLMTNRYPIAILKLNIDPEALDVNVHPAKTTIRIEDESKLYNEIFDAIRKTLLENELIKEEFEEQVTFASTKKDEKLKEKTYFTKDRQQVLEGQEQEQNLDLAILGQLNKTYILAEDKEGLLIIDQHAAEERYNYEQLMEKYSKGIETQLLVSPDVIELNPKDSLALNKIRKDLSIFGFQIEDFGENSFLIRSVPFILGKHSTTDILKDIIETQKTGKIEQLKEKMLIMMACKASVKAGKELTTPQMYELMKKLYTCKLPYSCPHGRPVIIRITNKDMEKKFKRIV